MKHSSNPQVKIGEFFFPPKRVLIRWLDPGYSKLYVIGNEYGALCAVWQRNEQDALDEAWNADLLKGLAIDEKYYKELIAEYGDNAPVMYLGNASEPADAEHAWITKIPRTQISDRLYAIMLAAYDRGRNTL